jgi:acetolactate synthase-1/2/3 large subunit
MSKAAPVVEKPRAEWGSDVIVDMLKAFEIEYIALNPGSSFRGLHDSLINYGGNHMPETILCPHEEIAVGVAHGYAKAKGKPMAAAVHNVVGLQHSSMAIYNAWSDRLPIIVLGGTGPTDSAHRRPRIDWVHTAVVQGNLVRRLCEVGRPARERRGDTGVFYSRVSARDDGSDGTGLYLL